VRSVLEPANLVKRWPAAMAMAAVLLAGCGGSPASSAPAESPTGTPGSASPTPAGSGSPATTPSGSATAPEAGAVLANIAEIGQTNVISNPQGNGFDIVHNYFDLSSNTDQSTLEAYDAAGNLLTTLPAGSFTGDCGAADVVNKKGRLIITMLVTTNPAQGIQPPSYSLKMTAWNAATGTAVWTASLVPAQDNQIGCPPGSDGELYDFSATLSGRWGVIELPVQGSSVSYDAVNLTTGKIYSRSDLLGVIGNYVVTGGSNSGDTGPVNMIITIPGSWPRLGTALASDQDGYIPLTSDGASSFAPQDYAATGYVWGTGPTGNGPSAVATSDGTKLIVIYSDGNGNTYVQGYALPSVHRLWNNATPRYYTDNLVAVNDSVVLIARSANGGQPAYELMALDPRTGKTMWTANIGSGSVCDLTSTQILVEDNGQLATLDAASGKQLSYETDPYQDTEGNSVCPAVVETGLSGVGMNNSQVLQLLSSDRS
jgi:hypothetical protein